MLTLIRSQSTECQDAKISKLSVFCGLSPVTLDVTDLSALPATKGTCIVASAHSLRQAIASGMNIDDVLAGLSAALIHSFDQSPESDAILEVLSNGALKLTRSVTGSSLSVEFSRDLLETSAPLRGCQFQLTGEGRWPVFDGHGCSNLMTLGGSPFLVSLKRGDCQLFLLAGGDLLDIDGSPSPAEPTAETYLALAPWLIFFRAIFADQCWHNPDPRAAWIIDDPLLRSNYGFLAFADLIKAADASDFTASIGFIPWNWRRNSEEVASLFRARPDRLSVCVHGCDHAGGEFKSDNETALRFKARLAMSRMHRMRKRTQVNFDPVMVFPQGSFSKTAMRTLGSEGFLAALNTSVFPCDWQPGDLSFRDIFDAAISRYGRCPLFSRRYPRSLFPLAFDLFMGKPALIVEHHDFFRNGYEPMCAFARRLQNQEPNLRWSSPAEILARTALHKTVGAHEQWVRFYTDSFVLRNFGDAPTTYRIQRAWQPDAVISHVLLDGRTIDARVNGSTLEAEVTLDPGDEAHIEVPSASTLDVPDLEAHLSDRARVAARRYLCEFRDNYLARSEWVLAMSQKMKERLL